MISSNSAIEPKLPRDWKIWSALFLLAAIAFLYAFIFVPPATPIAGNGVGDNLTALAPALQMYQGNGLIYRDNFEFVTPGVAVVNLAMFELLGLKLWIPNLLALLLLLGQLWLGILVARKLMHPGLALLPGAIFLVGLYPYLYDPNHHWYSMLFGIAAVAVLIEKRTPLRIGIAGFLCGLSASFHQTNGAGVALGLLVYFSWESRRRKSSWQSLVRKEALFVACILTAFLAVCGYFIWKAGPTQFFWSTVIWVLKYYPKQADLDRFPGVFWTFFPKFTPFVPHYYIAITDWLFLFAFPFVITLLFFAWYFRASSKRPIEYWERPMLVAIVSLFKLLSIASAPADTRMACCMMLPLILLGWFLDSKRKLARTLIVILVLGTTLTAIRALAIKRPKPVATLSISQSKLAFVDSYEYEETLWLMQHTRPLDYFFAAESCEQYFYLNLRNPTPLSFITNNGTTTSELVASTISSLRQRQVQYIMWQPADLDVLPEWENPSDDHLGPLRMFIQAHYKRIRTFGNGYEIWERAALQ